MEDIPTINRYYPTTKNNKSYPLRYDKSVCETFNKMNMIEMHNDYNKWEKRNKL